MMKTEFESGQECARAEVLAEFKQHWGHDIVRGIAWKLCERWGWEKPTSPFHPEFYPTPSAARPSPAAPGSAAPAAGAPERQSPAPPSLPPMGCLPPGSRAEVTNSIRAEQFAPPSAQTPDFATAKKWADRLNAEWFERLGKLEARIAQLEQSRDGLVKQLAIVQQHSTPLQEQLEAQAKQIEALWTGPCAPTPSSPASLAWHRWVWGYVDPLLKRLEALEQKPPQ